MLSNGAIEVNYIILIIALIAVLSALLIILYFSRQKYENKLQKIKLQISTIWIHYITITISNS